LFLTPHSLHRNIVHEVQSDSIDHLESNVERIQAWCNTFTST
jgi:hypothetical protein